MSSGGSSGGGSSTTVQKADPWEGQQPYLRSIFYKAQNMYNQGALAPDYYPDSTTVDMSDTTQQALDLQRQRALAGSPLTDAAQGELQRTISGSYLDPTQNTALQGVLDAALNTALPSVDAAATKAGRYGSGVWADTRAQAAQEAAASVYGDERTRQMQAMMFAPQMAQQDYQDIAALSEVGTAEENYAQQQLNELVNRYNYEQAQPMTALQNYLNLVQGNYGGSSSATTSTSGARSNPLGGALGGAAMGGGLAYTLGASNPLIGAAALGGGLLGLF